MAAAAPLHLALVTGLLLAVPGAEGSAGDWELIADTDGVLVWSKQIPDSPVLAFRGAGTVDVPVARLIGVMVDPERSPRWVDLLVESRWLRSPAAGEAILYNRYDSPWPLQDRDYVLHRVIRIDPDARVVTSTYRSIEDPAKPEQECCIRGLSERTSWTFTDLGDGSTLVEVEVLTDPRGFVPGPIVSFFQRSWPRRSILRLAAEARRPDVEPYPPLSSW